MSGMLWRHATVVVIVSRVGWRVLLHGREKFRLSCTAVPQSAAQRDRRVSLPHETGSDTNNPGPTSRDAMQGSLCGQFSPSCSP